MERSFILHMFTAGRQMSPFDVNMAVDAGYQVVVPYTDVTGDMVTGLTQDAIFSRGPKGVARTGIFIGGRDVMLAADMLDTARKAMVPPFEVSVFADPSGSYTTAAAMVACAERQLKKSHQTDFNGKRVLIIGGTGAVGRIAGAMAARLGANVLLASHSDAARAARVSAEVNQRFDVKTGSAATGDADELHKQLAEADVVFAAALAGVQVASADDLRHARRLLVAADVNAVPPEGIAGVGVKDDGQTVPGTQATALGALAIGNVKYQVQHRLFVRMCTTDKPVYLGFPEAFAMAREVVGEMG